MPEILTPEEVAELLRVPLTWVYEKSRPRCRNPLPCNRVGRYIRFSRSAVLEWFAGTASVQKAKRGSR
ncbi:MAG: helix-turn-helix domain-containing protein [Terriglobales bacterium]